LGSESNATLCSLMLYPISLVLQFQTWKARVLY